MHRTKPVIGRDVLFQLRLTAVIAAAIITVSALAQTGTHTFMRMNDEGETEAVQLTMPDLKAIRQPYFLITDLPIFVRVLVLSREQEAYFESLIRKHGEDFSRLLEKFDATPPVERLNALADNGHQQAKTILALDELKRRLPRGVTLQHGFTTYRTGPNEPPKAKVHVFIDVAEGEEVDESLLQTMRERVNAAAKLLVQRMLEREAALAAGEAAPSASEQHDYERLLAEHEELLAAIDALQKATAQTRAIFVGEAQAILTPEQLLRWPALERSLYRDRSIPKGTLPGEKIDLLKMLHELELPQESLDALATMSEAYDVALDSALRRRDALLADAPRKIDQAVALREFDRALALTERLTALHVAVRNLNQQYATSFAEALGSPHGEAFRTIVQRHAYPEVYRELRAHKMFAAIHDAADGLDAPLRATLAGLQQAYETEIAGINETLRRAFDEESPKAARLSIEHLKESVELNDWRPRDEDVIRARLAQRTALDERYCALLAETLGERYSALLPKPPAPRRKVVISSDDSDDVSR